MRRPTLGPRVSLALVAAVISLGAAGWSLTRAVRNDPPPVPSAAQGDHAAAAGPIFSGVTRAAVVEAVDSDPFRPERRRPGVRFRLPGEDAPAASPTGPTAVAELRLIGTVVSPDGGGFAMCQFGADTPKVVRVGERIGPYALVDVYQGRARFRAPGGELLDVSVPKAGD